MQQEQQQQQRQEIDILSQQCESSEQQSPCCVPFRSVLFYSASLLLRIIRQYITDAGRYALAYIHHIFYNSIKKRRQKKRHLQCAATKHQHRISRCPKTWQIVHINRKGHVCHYQCSTWNWNRILWPKSRKINFLSHRFFFLCISFPILFGFLCCCPWLLLFHCLSSKCLNCLETISDDTSRYGREEKIERVRGNERWGGSGWKKKSSFEYSVTGILMERNSRLNCWALAISEKFKDHVDDSPQIDLCAFFFYFHLVFESSVAFFAVVKCCKSQF